MFDVGLDKLPIIVSYMARIDDSTDVDDPIEKLLSVGEAELILGDILLFGFSILLAGASLYRIISISLYKILMGQVIGDIMSRQIRFKSPGRSS